MCACSRARGQCSYEFAALLLARLCVDFARQTGIVTNGIVQEIGLDGPGHNPQELHVKPLASLQVMSLQ
jgi:hypothetical protein